jgi:carbon monoxide dehydrogenase subunit G
MFCRVAASSQTARIAALDSIGASRGERDVLICARPNHSGLSLPMPLSVRPCCTCEYASLIASGGLPFGPAVLYLGEIGLRRSRRHPHGHDDERRSPACGAARGRVGQAERSGSAEGLHPGCEELERTEDNGFRATAKMKVGPVSARFKGKVNLSDLDPPNGYKISGEGEGGVAGFAKGGATVALAEKDGGTLLSYNVEAQIGGKLAQLGQRLINGAAKKLADEFFANFAKAVQG